MKRVSIIMPTYNRADYLAEALNSCLSQDYPNYEVIVVNDGSTDSTDKLMQFYLKNERVKYIKKDNGGPAHAINYGIRRTESEILTFAASDDIQLPNKVSLCLEALDDCDFGYTGYYHCNPRGQVWQYVPARPFTSESIRNCVGPSGGALVMRRKTWEKVPFRATLRVNEDLAWNIDAWNARLSCHMVDKPSFKYRMLSDGMSYSRKEEVDFITSAIIGELR